MSNFKIATIDYASKEFGCWEETVYAQEIASLSTQDSVVQQSPVINSNSGSEVLNHNSQTSADIDSHFAILTTDTSEKRHCVEQLNKNITNSSAPQREALDTQAVQDIFQVLRTRITVEQNSIVFKAAQSPDEQKEFITTSATITSEIKNSDIDGDYYHDIEAEFLQLEYFAQKNIGNDEHVVNPTQHDELQQDITPINHSEQYESQVNTSSRATLLSATLSRDQAVETFRAARKLFSK